MRKGVATWTTNVSKRIDWEHCEIDPDSGPESGPESGIDSGPEGQYQNFADDRSGGSRGRDLKPVSSDPPSPEAEPANDIAEAILGRLVIDDSDPFIIVSPDGYILHASPSYEELSRQSGGALLSGSASGTRSKISAAMRTACREAEALGGTVRYDERLILGVQERCMSIKYLPVFDQKDGITALVISFRDTTAQVKQMEAVNQAQNRFRDFARATSDWFWEVDRSLVVTTLTDRFTALTGTPTAQVIGMRIDEIGAVRPNIDGKDDLYGAIRRRISFRDQLLEVTTAAGEVRQFHMSGVPVFDRTSGEFAGYRGAGMDVTRQYEQAAESRRIRSNLEETLEQLTIRNEQLDIATTEAESALRTKNDFLASMSHELRTPLNAIIGFAEAIKMKVFGDLHPKYLGYSGDIVDAGRHLLSLIEDVLDVSVMERDELAMNIEAVSLKGAIEQARSLSIFRAQAKNLDLSWMRMEGDLMIAGDVRRIVQIFVNLLVNAIKFTPDGGRIGLETETTRDSQVLVTVWDNGIGIPADKHELIFERFEQVNENVYERSAEGSGLGLHISRELARHMGGDLTVESAPEKGSRFTVRLPLANVEED